jgi:hypothetical protein
MRPEQGSSTDTNHTITNPADAGSETAADGAMVLQEVVRMTGLSSDYLDGALSGLLGRPESSVNDLSLDELRNLLLECLESLNEQMGSEPAESKVN